MSRHKEKKGDKKIFLIYKLFYSDLYLVTSSSEDRKTKMS